MCWALHLVSVLALEKLEKSRRDINYYAQFIYNSRVEYIILLNYRVLVILDKVDSGSEEGFSCLQHSPS